MKSTLLILTVLFGASLVMGQRDRPAPPANNDPAAVNMVRTCESTGDVYYAMCAGWMGGLMLGIDASESLKDTRSICFPANAPSGSKTPSVQQEELRRILSKYVAANPKKLDTHAGHVAYQAFLEAFPCKKP